MERILYIPFDQLHAQYGVLKTANPKQDLIVFIESQRMTSGRPWHLERLFFLISSARHFAAELKSLGFKVEYMKAETTIDGLKQVKQQFGDLPIHCAEPSSFKQHSALREFGVIFHPNDFFLTPRELFAQWANSQKSYLMENFYRKQRVRLDVLMDGAKPVGGEWNFDKDNRLPPPKNYKWPAYLTHDRDAIDEEVAKELNYQPKNYWATTRAGALKQLDNFLKNHFANFGPYEDATTTENWALHHSLLSPYLNNGLLHPSEVIAAAMKRFKNGGIPIASAEAFVRQIIGWREYVNGMYWYLGESYRENNQLSANLDLPDLFRDPSATKMNCLKNTVSDINERSWVHHIPRLMILSNFALISGINPQQFLDWMREVFIDATDWVMVPNVIGMGVHADGGTMMTKPYAAGGSYISRMTNFCKGCYFDPKKRVGEDACPFTTLYWDFLDRNRESFSRNHRISQQLRGLDRLIDLPELRERAKQVIQLLKKGDL
ncbi:MAG: deoxyribodipyrimidine photolyase [Candidatus Nanopelagicaceae bacterium]|nr:deoxyribodipyrimidine photolyase [Candidatus Nanopelagicaceae bacterium]